MPNCAYYRAVFELEAPKAVIKSVFNASYYCYGNLFCCKSNNNVFTNGCQAVF